VTDPSSTQVLSSLLGACRTLHELSIDWLHVDAAPEFQLIDAIPEGCIQSLRIMPDRLIWRRMWRRGFSDVEPTTLMPPYERLAQAILRLGMRNSGRKVSVWFVVPRAPYVICDQLRDCVVSLWEKVEGTVSFGFQMTEVEPRNINRRHPITNLV